jgi:hypothetical protein
MNNTEKPQTPQGNFWLMMSHKNAGVTIAQLDTELAALVRQVKDNGGSGVLTLKIKISNNSKQGIKIDDELTIKAPKEALGSSYFFATDSGALLRNDPNQAELPMVILQDDQTTKAKIINS